MTIANPWYKLLEEEPCLQHKTIDNFTSKVSDSTAQTHGFNRKEPHPRWTALHCRCVQTAPLQKHIPSQSLNVLGSIWPTVKKTSKLIKIFRQEEIWLAMGCTNLLKPDNIRMPQWPVVYNFPLYIFIYLLKHNTIDQTQEQHSAVWVQLYQK